MPKRRHTPYDSNALSVDATFVALEDAPYTQQHVERVLTGAICQELERSLNEELRDVE